MAGARPVVGGPEFTPLPYGLWDAVQKPAPDPHWRQGVTYIERCPDAAVTYDECLTVTGAGDPPPAPAFKTDNVDQRFRGATPFTVFAEFDCSPVGLADAERAAVDALTRIENWQVERVFSTGSMGGITGQFPHLAANAEVLDAQGLTLQTAASVLVTGAGVDVADGLGRVEAELASCYGGQGLIHIPAAALPTFAAWDLAIERDGRLYTPRGNLLVVGGGYANTSPAGVAAPAGSAWIYATGAMFGYRSDVFFTRSPESFDRAENTMKMIAERTYVLGFSCCHIAALVDLGVPVS
jgi:hypothetical protein